MTATCRTYDVDGQPVRVRGARPMDEQDQAALAEVVRAAQKVLAQMPPEQVERQRLARECNRERLERLGPRRKA